MLKGGLVRGYWSLRIYFINTGLDLGQLGGSYEVEQSALGLGHVACEAVFVEL